MKNENPFKELVLQKFNGEKPDDSLEYNVRKKDGEWLNILVNIGTINYPDQPEPNILVIAYDITMRKKMEKKLEESEKKFRELVKYAPTAIYEVDFLQKKLLTINDAMCMYTGYSREELLSMSIMDFLPDKSKAELQTRIEKIRGGIAPNDHVEYDVISKDGHILSAILNMKFHFDEEGKPFGALVVAHDITEQKKTNEALIESERKLKENITKLEKTDKKLLEANRKYEELLDQCKEYYCEN